MKRKESYAPATENWQSAPNIEYRQGKRGGLAFKRNYVCPKTGERRRNGSDMKGLVDVAAAVQFVADEIRDIERNRQLPANGLLILDVAKAWAKQEKDPFHARRIKYLERYLREVLEDECVTLQDAATKQWLRGFIRSYAQGGLDPEEPTSTYMPGGCSLDGKQPGPNSVRKLFNAMESLYGFAVVEYGDDIIGENPATNMPKQWQPKGTKQKQRKPTILGSVSKLEEAIEKADEHYPAHADIFALMATLDVRRGEALGLQVPDVNLFWTNEAGDRGRIVFHGQWTKTIDRATGKEVWGYKPYLKGQERLPEEQRRPHVVEGIPPKLYDRLAKRIAQCVEQGTTWVFPNVTGERPNHHGLQRAVTNLGVKHLKVDRLSPHDLRRSYLTLTKKHDPDQKIAKHLANHTDEATTGIYVYELPEERREGIEAATELRRKVGVGY